MHPESHNIMREMLAAVRGQHLDVLDVGSLDVNGSFKPLVKQRGWYYTGLDIVDGPNVDVVADDPFSYPFDDDEFDVVISGSTMEHVTEIWHWVPELVRVLRPGGSLCIHTHWRFMEHKYPVDCWRILPDGMKFLFDMTGELTDYDIRIMNKMDIMGMARKAG